MGDNSNKYNRRKLAILQFDRSLTVDLLDSQPVIQGQLVVGNVLHSTLVVWPHNGWVGGGMGQAQRVAKLMHCNCEQVCAAAAAA